MTSKVVFDTSSLVSAALRPDSIPDQAVTLALGKLQLCVSAELLAQLNEVLNRSGFDTYVSLESRMSFVETVRTDALWFSVAEATRVEAKGSCRDESDDFVLGLALEAGADAIVSSDRDLLVLHPWRGISILTPAQFLVHFAA
jgi:putative PIN family toxin of toxin-antitoxin system